MDDTLQLKENSEATNATKKIAMPSGKLENILVYKIPISLLKYNRFNGRIGTWILEQESNNINIDTMSQHDFNDFIGKAIKKSNPNSYNKTKNNIRAWGQEVPGVVLSNGVVIDGNRRFTCLRELSKENIDNKYNFFEAVILDVKEITAKESKKIEWHLQLGTEKRLDYDPIEILLDMYHYIEETKEFTIEEYSKYANIDIKRAKEKLSESFLLKDYLDHIKNSKKWSIAKEDKIEGSLDEIRKILGRYKNDEEEQNQFKEILFDYVVANPVQGIGKDVGKYIRDIGNEINKANISDKRNFMEKHINVNNKIEKMLSQSDDINVTLKEIRKDVEIYNSLVKNVDNLKWSNHKLLVANLPIKILEDFIKKLDCDINDSLLSKLDVNEKNNFFNLIDDILKRLEKIKFSHKN